MGHLSTRGLEAGTFGFACECLTFKPLTRHPMVLMSTLTNLRNHTTTVGFLFRSLEVKHWRVKSKALGLNPANGSVDEHYWEVP